MVIETKHNIGDKVYFLYNDRIEFGEINQIHIKIFDDIDINITYVINKDLYINGIKCFKTKDELLDSL